MRYWHFNSIKVQLEHHKLQCNSEGLQNFNSIKVQLELVQAKVDSGIILTFQFHKGTIRTDGLYLHRFHNGDFNSIKVQFELHHHLKHTFTFLNFNSIKVQLERQAPQSEGFRGRFQFHKGTIRTLNSFLLPWLPIIFQFHKGTIRTFVFLQAFSHFQVFQYHKGTIRTSYAQHCLYEGYAISIP